MEKETPTTCVVWTLPSGKRTWNDVLDALVTDTTI
jgi:hypothetical protein